MPIRMKPEYETFNHLQTYAVNKVILFTIYSGCVAELPHIVGLKPRGELYFFQMPVTDAQEEKEQREFLSEMTASFGQNAPSYEDLAETDGMITLRATYHIGKGEQYDNAIMIDEVTPLDAEDYMTVNEDGDLVRASSLED